MVVYREHGREFKQANRIAANLSRLLPDFGWGLRNIDEDLFGERQGITLRQAVETSEFIDITIACNSGKISANSLPLLLSNPIIAKAASLLLHGGIPPQDAIVDRTGNIQPQLIHKTIELIHKFAVAHIDLDRALKAETLSWREVAALARDGMQAGLLTEEEAFYTLSDGNTLRYLMRALQLAKILKAPPIL